MSTDAPKGSLVAAVGTASSADEDADFESLVEEIKENPERILTAKLSDEQLLELQKRLNPYSFVPGGNRGGPQDPQRLVKSLFVSFTNLREDYIKRNLMTSLVGFIYQMVEEWSVPPEVRGWVPKPRKKGEAAAAAAAADAAPFDPTVLVGKLDAALGVAKEALAAKKDHEAAAAKAAEELCVDEKSAAYASAKAASDELAAKSAGLLYAATNIVARLGVETEKRVDATVAAAAAFPQVRAILDRSNIRPGVGNRIEMPADIAKGIITNFVDTWFRFDPNLHVRSAREIVGDESKSASQKKVATKRLAEYVAKSQEEVAKRLAEDTDAKAAPADADPEAPLTFEEVAARAPKPETPGDAAHLEVIRASRPGFGAACAALRDADLADALRYALASPESALRFKRYLFPIARDSAARPALDIVPPQDTFHRWNYYAEVNYEELRTATEVLYAERPDLEFALGVWSQAEGTEKDVEEAYQKYCERYQDELPSTIKRIEVGEWCLLGDFKAGRQKMSFYNRHTEVIKKILDRHTDDKKLGADLMRKRVMKQKAANINKDGPDAPGLKEYSRSETKGPAALGAEKPVDAVAMRRLERARGNMQAARDLEVYEQYETRIVEFRKIASSRPLTKEEKYECEEAQRHLARAAESLEVPDDALQVDTFTHDTKTGEFVRSKFFTAAEKPEFVDKARKDALAGVTAPPLAPFATQLIAQQDSAPVAGVRDASGALGRPRPADPSANVSVTIPGTGISVPIPAGATAVTVESIIDDDSKK